MMWNCLGFARLTTIDIATKIPHAKRKMGGYFFELAVMIKRKFIL
ncbi:hypothetical protein SYNPCC7002_A1988 [Picosynechococcus sp. PCC 7002]|nr:hypothetical protein SYNPCC7002_A1988 [Picosynechococcus sp. PCC 7002]